MSCQSNSWAHNEVRVSRKWLFLSIWQGDYWSTKLRLMIRYVVAVNLLVIEFIYMAVITSIICALNYKWTQLIWPPTTILSCGPRLMRNYIPAWTSSLY